MVWPRQVQDFEKMMMNEFSGIGIEISKPRGLLTVASLLPDTPAYRAGLDAGDVSKRLTEFHQGHESDLCRQEDTGPKGTSVVLGRSSGARGKGERSRSREIDHVPTIRCWQRTEAVSGCTWSTRPVASAMWDHSFSSETSGDFETVLRNWIAGLRADRGPAIQHGGC